ncbi:MAG: hypothetical protein AAF567_01585 [Actinomycetota bacterium]
MDVVEQPSRRELIVKSAAAATVAGVVWSAPRIEGLSLRPSYASASSGGSGQFIYNSSLGQSNYSATGSPCCLGSGSFKLNGSASVMAAADPSGASLAFIGGDWNYDGPGTLSAVNADPPALNVNVNLVNQRFTAMANTTLPAATVTFNFNCA